MSGPNAVIGDLDEPTRLPVTNVPEEELTEEKKMAKYSRSSEYKKLKKHLEDRKLFYQHFLPNGELVEGDPKDPQAPFTVATRGAEDVMYWKLACLIIREINNILDAYETAAENVKS